MADGTSGSRIIIPRRRRRDLDQNAAGAGGGDLRGEVVLQLQRQPVVHVDLDRDQQELAHPQDRDAIHVRPAAA